MPRIERYITKSLNFPNKQDPNEYHVSTLKLGHISAVAKIHKTVRIFETSIQMGLNNLYYDMPMRL